MCAPTLSRRTSQIIAARPAESPTHWTPLGPPPHERVGVNARLIDEALLEGVPMKQVDGASWDG